MSVVGFEHWSGFCFVFELNDLYFLDCCRFYVVGCRLSVLSIGVDFVSCLNCMIYIFGIVVGCRLSVVGFEHWSGMCFFFELDD